MMGSGYTAITVDQMQDVLGKLGFQRLQLKGVKELVWAKRVDKSGVQLSLRVFSSIDPDTGLTRPSGKDAIRVQVATRVGDQVKHVGGSKRVHRVSGWSERLILRVQTWEDMLGPQCPNCGSPTVERKGPRGPFYGCVNFPGCRGTINTRQQV